MKLFGKVEKMPETVAELAALCPELIAEAKKEAVDAVNVEGAKKEAADAASAAADKKYAADMDRLHGIIGAALSEEIAGKIKVIFESGVTGEQYKAIGSSLLPPAADSAKEMQLKTDLLTALKASGAANPGHEGQAKGKPFNTDTDSKAETQEKIDKLVAQYQKDNPQATYRDAIIAVSEKNPELFRDRTREE